MVVEQLPDVVLSLGRGLRRERPREHEPTDLVRRDILELDASLVADRLDECPVTFSFREFAIMAAAGANGSET